MNSNKEQNYPYKNLPLTPAIIEILIADLFLGKLLVRQAIVDGVVNYHEKNGGAKANVQDVPRSVKKALSNLRKKGFVDNPSYGYWGIGIDPILPTVASESISLPIESVTPEPAADIVIGTGNSAIYLYYLPMYRQKALESNETRWLCKIGKTDRDPLLRVLSQAATALPEKPHIALIFRTNFAFEFETSIHNVLAIHGRKADASPGSEWYFTSPEEVEKIITMILSI